MSVIVNRTLVRATLALGLALPTVVPALAKDADLPVPPVPTLPQQGDDCFAGGKFSVGDTCVVSRAPVQDDPATQPGVALVTDRQNVAIQLQILDTLREIAADLEAIQIRTAGARP